MSKPQADGDNFQTAPTEPRDGIAREGVAGPPELAKRQELPYDDSPAVAAVAMFFAGLFIIALALFFFVPGPKNREGWRSTKPARTRIGRARSFRNTRAARKGLCA